jgi:hypothetical protein
MPNATVRANARALPEATNRRAVLGAILAAGATAILPAEASTEPQLSAIDREVLDLWQRRQQMVAICEDESFDPSEAEEEVFMNEFCGVLWRIDQRIGASTLALGAVLIAAVMDKSAEPVKGMNRASLRAIRPQLVGAIAEAADRVLAALQAGEDA